MTFVDTGSPQFFNRYSYTFNDPINLIDPNGESPAKVVRFGVKVVKHKGDVKKAGRETFMEISESIGELADGDVSIDDVFAVIDLLSPVSIDEIGDAVKAVKETKKQRKARIKQQRKESKVNERASDSRVKHETRNMTKEQKRDFHDAKKSGESDRSVEQVKQDREDIERN